MNSVDVYEWRDVAMGGAAHSEFDSMFMFDMIYVLNGQI